MDHKQIGARLRAARERQRLTQAEVAVKLGLTQPTIHAIEAGDSLPKTRMLRRFAEVYRVPLASMIP